MSWSIRTGRRTFIRSSALAAGTLLTARAARAIPGANERIAVGIVGMGVRGSYHARSLGELASGKLANVDVTAVAEPWRLWRERAVATVEKAFGHKPAAFVRHTDLLEKGGVDAVVIATPDFWHVPVLLDAVKAGKDVYVEKPLSVTLEEAKAARDAVKASKSVVQVGTQRRSDNISAAAREFVRSGRLGKISSVVGAYNDDGPRWTRPNECKQMKEADFDWKWYLRDLPDRPFNPRHVLEWKLFREFTMGCSGLLGCHFYDLVQFIMDCPWPASAVAQGGVFVYKDGRQVEDTFETLIEFPEEFILHYTTRLGNAFAPDNAIYGTNGTLKIEKGTFEGLGGTRGPNRLPDKPQKLAAAPDRPYPHMLNFLECMRSRSEPVAPIEAGYRHALTSILAQEAMITGRKLRYDREKDAIV
ncbi:MAG: Gfo/Idh/MocA family oxidoreductase [Phycisphaerae bacterium]|jgi:predicted dehydrogenase